MKKRKYIFRKKKKTEHKLTRIGRRVTSIVSLKMGLEITLWLIDCGQ